MLKASVTFPGIKDIVSFQYTLEHGVSPGIATIMCTPQRGWPAKKGDIVMTFGGTKMVLKGFVPDNLSFQYDQSGLLWRLNLLDRRINWRYGQVTGVINKRLPNGPVDAIDQRTRYSAMELIGLLMKKMGETNYLIASKYVPSLYPSFTWVAANPAQELASLCDMCGLRVVLRTDNRVAILPKGRGGNGDIEPVLPNGPIISDSGTFDPPERPKSIIFVCGPTRYQVDMALEAVGDDVDGLVKPIDELSYKPPNGWDSIADVIHFKDVPLMPPGTNIKKDWLSLNHPRELAKQSIYKKYRATIYGLSGRRIAIPGLDEKKNPIKLEDIRNLLPIGQELIEPTFDPEIGWYKPVNCVIWGSYLRGLTISYPATEIQFQDGSTGYRPIPIVQAAIDPTTGQRLTTFETTVIPPDQYSVDGETGIVTFSRRYLRQKDSDNPTITRFLPAVLVMRTSVCINSRYTFTPIRHTVERPLPNPTINESYYVRDDDIYVRNVPKFYEQGNQATDNGYTDNMEVVKKAAKERLDSEERKFMTKGPRHVRYAGWMNIMPDGGVQQISWTFNQAGAFTDASINDEIAVVTIPYAERRFIERAKYGANNALANLDSLMASRAYPFSKSSGLR